MNNDDLPSFTAHSAYSGLDGAVAPKLTGMQVRSLQYFHEKSDVTSWLGWEECIPSLEAHHPEVLAAIRDLDISERILEAVINNLEYSDD